MSRDAATSEPAKEFLSVREAAKLLGVGKDAIYEACGRDDIPHRRIGKRIVLARAALIAWVSCKSLPGNG